MRPRPTILFPVLPVTEQRLVLISGTHWPHRFPRDAAAVAHAVTARTEAEYPREVRAVRVERTWPVVADAACTVEAATVAVASGGQEETVAVTGCEQSAVHAVLGRPCYGRVVVEFLELLLGRHTPATAPVGRSRVILRQEGDQVVGETVIAITGVVAVLGHGVVATHAVLVGAPIVGVLGLGLAPGKVVAVFFGSVCSNVADGPQSAARQAEVNVGMIDFSGKALQVAVGKAIIGHHVGTHVISCARGQTIQHIALTTCNGFARRVAVVNGGHILRAPAYASGKDMIAFFDGHNTTN